MAFTGAKFISCDLPHRAGRLLGFFLEAGARLQGPAFSHPYPCSSLAFFRVEPSSVQLRIVFPCPRTVYKTVQVA
jgi:hypothetical protein